MVVITTRLRPFNLILCAIAAALAAAVLTVEGYLARVDVWFALFGVVVLAGAAIASLRFLSTRRWLALFCTAGAFGLVTQRVGVGVGAWHYTNHAGTYGFVFFAFGFGSLFIYGVASLLTNFFLPRRLPHPPVSVALVILLGALVLFAGTGYGANRAFALYYAALIAFALLFSALARTQTIVAVALASAGFGLLAESLGAHSHLWQFEGHGPPLWLIAISWPFEGILHFGLSSLLVRESPDPPRLYTREPHQFALRPTHPMAVTAANCKVVVRRGSDDKRGLLDDVLAATGFFALLERKQAASGRSRADFRIALKPNFMFMYSKADHSTFTDPELVEHLIDRLVQRGFPNVAIVEAQSCYGNEFAKREVAHVAAYVGYGAKNYRVVDLTLEKVPHTFPPPLGAHAVGPTWRDADFRISFAKNKTHTWAVYTLTIKNIYGALAEQDKLLEYHNRREIYPPTICMLLDFPVDFGLVDAFYSADGPFGIFADREPNYTQTILGGENLLAVDWVGATLMGLDPLKSRYMQLAVQAFGTPAPQVDGDLVPYAPWVNVPDALLDAVDAGEEMYGFTSLVFHLMNRMDGVFPRKPHSLPWRLTRLLLEPLRARIFVDPLGADGKKDPTLK